MKKLMSSALVGAAMVFAGAADAADIARPVYKAVPVVPAYNWTGFYVGGNIGYGFGDANATAFGLGASSQIEGLFAGGQLGYNWQSAGSPWVFGIEVDSQWADVKTAGSGTSAFSRFAISSLDYFGTARARVGYAWDRVMVYGTGGLAWGTNEITFPLAGAPFAAGLSQSNTHIGLTLGAGVEVGTFENWSVKVEYLYLKLDNENYFANTTRAGLGFDADLNVHTIKVGLNYRFGYGKAPVVAKY